MNHAENTAVKYRLAFPYPMALCQDYTIQQYSEFEGVASYTEWLNSVKECLRTIDKPIQMDAKRLNRNKLAVSLHKLVSELPAYTDEEVIEALNSIIDGGEL